MRSFPQRGEWFFLCRAQWVLCHFSLFLPVCFPQAGVLKQAGPASLGFMDERDTLCLSMPHSFFDCKPSKALLSTTLGKNQIRCRVFAISTKFSKEISAAPFQLRVTCSFWFSSRLGYADGSDPPALTHKKELSISGQPLHSCGALQYVFQREKPAIQRVIFTAATAAFLVCLLDRGNQLVLTALSAEICVRGRGDQLPAGIRKAFQD